MNLLAFKKERNTAQYATKKHYTLSNFESDDVEKLQNSYMEQTKLKKLLANLEPINAKTSLKHNTEYPTAKTVKVLSIYEGAYFVHGLQLNTNLLQSKDRKTVYEIGGLSIPVFTTTTEKSILVQSSEYLREQVNLGVISFDSTYLTWDFNTLYNIDGVLTWCLGKKPLQEIRVDNTVENHVLTEQD